MIIKSLTVGMIQANCFIVGCERTKEAAIIDPGDEADRILMALAKSKLKVKYIINTHGHFDHTGANKRIKEVTAAPLLIHKLDQDLLNNLSSAATNFGLSAENSPPPDKTLDDGDKIQFGDITIEVIHTPGHTPGGISLYTENALFAGDTLFAGSIGRTDFPGGDYNTLIASIKNKLFTLPDNVKVYPGHMHNTEIGLEKKTNPFLR